MITIYTITRQCVEHIIEYTKEHYPFECCGVISTATSYNSQLEIFHPIKNSHVNPRHFYKFDEQEWIDCNLTVASNKRFIICYVHSHIDAPPSLSQADLDKIVDYTALQMIVYINQKNSPLIYLYRYNANTKVFENCLLTFT